MVCAAGPGTLDIVTRAVSQKLSEQLGQPVVVENRPGAGTSIGEEMVARSVPDGYTLVMTGMTLATAQFLRSNMKYDPIKDLAPISLIATAGNVLVVNQSLPVKSVKDLIELSKSRGKPLFYGVAVYGASGHIASELFQQMTGTKFEGVPYKGGSGQSLQGLLAGDIDMTFDNIPPTLAHIRGGKLRPLAVTSSKRSPQLPNVPTMAEEGLAGYAISAWFGMLGPAGIPSEIAKRVQLETARALAAPEVKERLGSLGFEAVGNSPEEFRAFISAESDKLGRVIRTAGMKSQ
jgi:tripartite-type tricarboxylate transporter receptor subunit TctC